MALKTPFFKAFGPLLFGRGKTSVLKSLQDLESLEDLYAIFGHLFEVHLLDPTEKGVNSRRRRLPASVTFWAFVAQALSPRSSCREVARRIEVWWRWGNLRSAQTITPSAYCQARQRLTLHTLQIIAGQVAWAVERHVLKSEKWLEGREVKIIDGTGVSMPDTPENQAIWPQPVGQKPGCGFPVMKVAGLFSLASGALLEHVAGRQTTHDSTLFRELWGKLKKGDIILADRAFCSYGAMAALAHRGIDTVVRLHQLRKSDFRFGRRLGLGDRLVVWTKPKQCPEVWSQDEFARLPEQLPVRLVRTVITAEGFRTRSVLIIPTLTNAEVYPAKCHPRTLRPALEHRTPLRPNQDHPPTRRPALPESRHDREGITGPFDRLQPRARAHAKGRPSPRRRAGAHQLQRHPRRPAPLGPSHLRRQDQSPQTSRTHPPGCWEAITTTISSPIAPADRNPAPKKDDRKPINSSPNPGTK